MQKEATLANTRLERDTLGEIAVPADAYWGAQTQRSLENFRIGTEKMPPDILTAFALLKKGAAEANLALGKLDARRAELICAVCDGLLSGALSDQFPLSLWQTGSGTQTNMNFNEVIARRGNELAGEALLHPNDHVNMSQSSNDTFPTAMHLAAVCAIADSLLPALSALADTFGALSGRYADVVKIGRTHLQDATPLTLGQEFGGWQAMLMQDAAMLRAALPGLYALALGGTAVGTGLNAPARFGEVAAEKLSALTGKPFVSAPNKFQALSSRSALVFAHGALKTLAADLMKIAGDVRLLSCGPRCGIGELIIPANEPGSSIMPGKVNPTQCEALCMVGVQVMGNDAALGFAASQGQLQLNVYMPVCAQAFLQSVRLLADGVRSFEANCARGIRPNLPVIEKHLRDSLMLVTALSPRLGYERAAQIARHAYENGLTLKAAAAALGLMAEEEFEKAVRPESMVGPQA